MVRRCNLMERFLCESKRFRRVAARYEKLAANFLAMVLLASMRLWLCAYRVCDLMFPARFPKRLGKRFDQVTERGALA